MSFWIFKCNSTFYRINERLADVNPKITWNVFQHREEIGPGDTVFLWITGADRHIRAVMKVDEALRKMAELESEQAYWNKRDTETLWRVVCTLIHRDVRLPATALRQVPGLEDLSMFHGEQRGTNFPVTPDEAAIIMRLILSG